MADPLIDPPFLPGLIPRPRLVQLVQEGGARAIALTAPAGYGKTVLAQQLAQAYELHAVCDCAGVDVLLLCKRIIGALIEESGVEHTETLTQTAIGLEQNDLPAWRDFAMRAWRRSPLQEALFVFENVESLRADVSAMRLIAALLRTSPETRTALLCSRNPVTLRLRVPRRLQTVTGDDLRFSDAEIRELFPPKAPAAVTERVSALTQGWPIATMFLARLYVEGTFEAVADRLDSVAFEDLYAYLADAAVSQLLPGELRVLTAASAILEPGEADVAAACGDAKAGDTLKRLAAKFPFVQLGPHGSFSVHPFLASALRARFPQECREYVLRAATAAAERGERFRAGRLYLSLGEKESALHAVEGEAIWMISLSSAQFAAIVSRVDDATLMRFPASFSAAFPFKAYNVEPQRLVEMTESVYRSLPEHTPTVVKAGMLSSVINAYYNVGNIRECKRLLEEFIAPLPPNHDGPEWVALDLWRSAIDVYTGRFTFWENGARERVLAGVDISVRALLLRDIVARMHRTRGETAQEWAALEEAIRDGDACGLLVVPCVILVEIVFAGWLYGKDDAFAAALDRLEREIAPVLRAGVGHLIECARGRAATAATGYEQLQARCYAYLIAISLTNDPREKERLANLALAAARQSEQVLYIVFALVAAAEFSRERDVLLAEAAAVAATIESEPLQRAVAALRANGSNAGMLEPLLRRLHGAPVAQALPLRVELLCGRIVYRGEPGAFTAKEALLLFALAASPRVFTRDELHEMLWPGQSAEAASNVLRVMISRIRSRVSHEAAIVHGKHGYRLGPGVDVDLWRLETAIGAFRRGDRSTETMAALESAFNAMLTGRPSDLVSQPWFAPTEARLEMLEREIAAALGNAALERGDPRDAYRVAAEMLIRDRCDEQACGIAMRALASMGRQEEVLETFRAYSDALAEDYGAEPSPEIVVLRAACLAGRYSRL